MVPSHSISLSLLINLKQCAVVQQPANVVDSMMKYCFDNVPRSPIRRMCQFYPTSPSPPNTTTTFHSIRLLFLFLLLLFSSSSFRFTEFSSIFTQSIDSISMFAFVLIATFPPITTAIHPMFVCLCPIKLRGIYMLVCMLFSNPNKIGAP